MELKNSTKSACPVLEMIISPPPLPTAISWMCLLNCFILSLPILLHCLSAFNNCYAWPKVVNGWDSVTPIVQVATFSLPFPKISTWNPGRETVLWHHAEVRNCFKNQTEFYSISLDTHSTFTLYLFGLPILFCLLNLMYINLTSYRFIPLYLFISYICKLLLYYICWYACVCSRFKVCASANRKLSVRMCGCKYHTKLCYEYVVLLTVHPIHVPRNHSNSRFSFLFDRNRRN